MSGLTASLLQWTRQHHDVASIQELRELGVSDDEVRHLVRTKLLVPVHRGVYRIAGAPETLLLHARAACVANASAVIGMVSAARLWEGRKLPRTDRIDVMSEHGRVGLTSPRLNLRRSTDLPQSDIVTRPDGIRLTSPPRTLFDLASVLDRNSLESITEQVLDRHCSIPTLFALGRRLAGRGRTGTTAFATLLDSRPAWQRPADSDIELAVLRGLERRGLVLVRQHRLDTRIGPIHLDGADPAVRWGVEIDHVTWHGGRFDTQYDKRRDLAAGLLGWEIKRVPDDLIRENLDGVVDDLVALHRRRGHDLSGHSVA